MVDFAGWEMPIQYTSIIEEHHAVRTAAGMFDIAHMGRLFFSGPDACDFLDSLVTNDVTKIAEGQIRYSLVTNEQGGILDDVLIYRFPEEYLVVVNASNREKIVQWFLQHKENFQVTMDDRTLSDFMFAIQGPLAVEILNPLIDTDISQIKYYWATATHFLDVPVLVSRTGYTGEDGFEVIVSGEHATEVWKTTINEGKDRGILPTGLGCRDTLRLEAAMPLYGHEMDESVEPYTAGLGFGVRLKAGDFIGKDALVAAKAKPDKPVRIGLEMQGKRIAREGANILSGENKIGEVTSGTFSPTFQKPLAMGYVPAANSTPGSELTIDIRGKVVGAKVVELPFYKRETS